MTVDTKRKVRVLVVDDALVARRILSDAISSDPSLELAGSASNGAIALQKIRQLSPDIVTLDIEMPGMSGIEVLIELRKEHPMLPVIMFSTLTGTGARETLEALSLGASDYLAKPSGVSSIEESKRIIATDLITKIKLLTGAGTKEASPAVGCPSKSMAATQRAIPRRPPVHISAVVIGVSTGGPNALATIMPDLAPDLGIPIFVVQHMPPVFTRLLADRLQGLNTMQVVEAEDQREVRPNTMYVAPGDYHLALLRNQLNVYTHLSQGPKENSCRPAVDVLFRSAADVYGPGVLGVILTGMGSDGLAGCRYIKEAGGCVLAQDKASSVVWGMPGAVVNAGLVDTILPLSAIAAQINQIVKRVPPISTPAHSTSSISH